MPSACDACHWPLSIEMMPAREDLGGEGTRNGERQAEAGGGTNQGSSTCSTIGSA